MSTIIIVLAVLIILDGCKSQNQSTAHILYSPDGSRIRGFSHQKDSDFVLGGFFAVHDPSPQGDCSVNLDDRALERVEAFLYAIDSINNDSNLLPNISLGYEVRDTCSLQNIALDETIRVILDESRLDATQCNDISNTSLQTIVAMIGPTSSRIATSVAGLLRLFHVPQISYSASATALNNRDRYGYFYRTIPPDDLQAQAMIDLVLQFDWSLVNIVHSNNEYGESGSEGFRQIAKTVGICIDLDLGINEGFEDKEFVDLATDLYQNSSSGVVVFFSSRNFIGPFMKQFNYVKSQSNETRHFIWIASDSWAQAKDIVNEYHDIVAGRLLGIAPLSTSHGLDDFENYLSRLTLASNTRDPWFTEYFQYYHNCSSDCPKDIDILYNTNYSYTPFNVQLVIESVYSIAHAINNYLIGNCELPIQWNSDNQTCVGQQRQLNGTILRQYLGDVNFTSPFNKRIYFDDSGNPEGSYEITNYYSNHNSSESEFVKIGIWMESAATVDERLVLFINKSLLFSFSEEGYVSPLTNLTTSCPTCPIGNVREMVSSSCCRVCVSCVERNYTTRRDASVCDVCTESMWGNDPLIGSNSCVPIKNVSLDVTNGFGIFLTVLAFVGLTLSIVIILSMIKLWNTPLIKSSGREQMVLLLIGVVLCFLQTVFFIMKPSYAICFFQRAGTWLCFSIILSALLIKLVRIARIFLRNNLSQPPRFIQPCYQILFTLLLVTLQMILVLVSLILVYPKARQTLVLNNQNTNDHPLLLIQCETPHSAMFVLLLLYYSIMLVVSNALAIITIKFPDNFNEVRYVAFTTFSVSLVWIAFCVSYFATKPQYHTALFAFGIQASAMAVLFCFFLPRIFGAIAMKYFNDKELYTFSSGSSNNRLSVQIATDKLTQHRIAGEVIEEEFTTNTFK